MESRRFANAGGPNAEVYRRRYAVFRELYLRTRELMATLDS
jgi:hypothetical protein